MVDDGEYDSDADSVSGGNEIKNDCLVEDMHRFNLLIMRQNSIYSVSKTWWRLQ